MYKVTLFGVIFNALVICNSAREQESGKCDYKEWTCKSGQCIAEHDKCDGKVNCNDGSDETPDACLIQQCVPYAFRCSYGACVIGNAACDGHVDCADGSDELASLCTNTNTWNTNAESFHCTSGQVISFEAACDGNKDCQDGSDETLANCSSRLCPPLSFRCAYGACVIGTAACDGTSDCADGSDELPNICKLSHGSGPHPSATAIRQQTGQCSEEQWTCKSGQCIYVHDMCDGKVNCNDGSDETSEACLYTLCPEYAFRCSYGACIDGDTVCNGHADCADRSDELDILCTNQTTPLDDRETFYCTSGQVIARDEACDGKNDCRDGSDETLANCGNNRCPTISFRCAYGACIYGTGVCDGVSDCADGSDEIGKDCESKRQPGADPLPTRSPPHTGTPTQPVKPKEGCPVPNVPHLIVSPPFNDTMKIPPGEIIDSFGTVLYSCEHGHALHGVQSNLCSGDDWIDPHPKCLKYCSSRPLLGITISATCEERETFGEISCDGVLPAGVRARIRCAPGYVKPPVFRDIIECGDDGTWDYPPSKCIAECGREYDPRQKFVAGGDAINSTVVPWNVGIYQLKQGRYEYICGGSIISAKIVVSAAHCFWDVRAESLRTDLSIYTVAVAKYYQDYYTTETLSTQFFNVSEIAIPRGYHDADFNYNDNIAVLVLNKFISFREHIRPICVDWNLSKPSEREVPSEVGTVPSWGETGPLEGNSSELSSIDLQAITYDQCGRELPPNIRRYLTGDKFCVPGGPNKNVCRGASGAGFAIPKMMNGHRVYSLWGVVSHCLTDTEGYNDMFYTAVTNVQHHKALLEKYETKYRP